MLQKDFFSHIEHHYSKNLPFVIYRKPKVSSINAFLQNTEELFTTKDFKASGFVFAPFDSVSQTVLIPLEHSKMLTCKIESEPKNELSKSNIEPNTEGKAIHLNLVQQGVNAIHETPLQKVVLSRCETLNISDKNPFSIFKQLIDNYPKAFVYCWYHPKIGLWLGATPETLIKVNGKRFETMALAGTQLYQDTLNVTWQQKEKEEQQFVTDFIVEALNTSVSHLIVSEAKTIKAGSLLHLQSNISGILNAELQTILNRLHPTPAVCGLPVKAAQAFIIQHEPYNREYYTGFLGELNLKESTSRNTNRRNVENNAYSAIKTVSHLFVNLRCMQIKNQHALIYVGGGITKDSNSQLEWEETVSKSAIMKRVLIQ